MVLREYRDFQLVADVGEDDGERIHITVQVHDAPAGQIGPVQQSVKLGDLEGHLGVLERHTLDQDGIVALGETLRPLLLPDEILLHFARSLEQLEPHQGLRLRLRLSPRLASIPWEYLHFQRDNGPKEDTGFLALDPRISIVREEGFPLTAQPDATPKPRRLLAALSSPEGHPAWDLQQGRTHIEWALQDIPGITTEFLENVTPPSLSVRLREGADIFLFVGPGNIRFTGRNTNVGSLEAAGDILLVGEDGKASPIRSDRLAMELREHGVQLVVLLGGTTDSRENSDMWNGVAPELVRSGIPAVLAMRYQVWNEGITEFYHMFYQALAAGLPLEQAVSAARLALFNMGEVRGGDQNPRMFWSGWGSAALFMPPNGLFALPAISDEQQRQAVAAQPLAVLTQRQEVLTGRFPLSKASRPSEGSQESSPQQAPVSETPPPASPTEPEFWLVVADPAQYDWDLVFDRPPTLEGVRWAGSRGAEAQQNIRQTRPGDFILAYRATPDQYITGIGRVTSEPYEIDDRSGRRYAVDIQMLGKLDNGLTLSELRRAVPDLQLLTRPRVSFSPVTPDQWTIIRTLILHHNSNLAVGDLPPATVPLKRRVEIVELEPVAQWINGKFFGLSFRVRNGGNVTWPSEDELSVSCDLMTPGLTTEFTWTHDLSEDVPPGGEFMVRLTKRGWSVQPGEYDAFVTVTIRGLEGETEAGTGRFRVQILLSDSTLEPAATADKTSVAEHQPPDTRAVVQASMAEAAVEQARFVEGRDDGQGDEGSAPQPKHETKPAELPSPLSDPVPVAEASTERASAPSMERFPAPPVRPTTVVTREMIERVVERYQPPPLEHTVSIRINSENVVLSFGGNDYVSSNRFDPVAVLESQSSPKELGKRLFEAIIHDNGNRSSETTLDGYNTARAIGGHNLRFKLSFPNSAFHAYMWECLRDPKDDTPLSVVEASPFYRREGNTSKGSASAQPLKILVAICNPTTLRKPGNSFLENLEPLNIAQERDIVETALRRLKAHDLAEYRILESENGAPVTMQALREELEEGYHVLHILAHGLTLMKHTYYLIMEAPNRQHQPVPEEDLKSTLRDTSLRLVVLAACQSATSDTGEVLSGLGQSLARRGVPAVIAMQDYVSIEAAQLFTQHFYDDLARSGRVDMAMGATRRAMYQWADRGKRDDWAIPVLLMSTDDGRLFDVSAEKAAQLPDLQPDIRDYTQVAGGDNPTTRRLASALRAAAHANGAPPALMSALPTMVMTAPAAVPAPQEAEPQVLQQDRAVLRQFKNKVDIAAADLRDFVEQGDEGLRLPDTVYGQIASALNAGKHVILIGPPGTGKTSLARAICRFAERKGFAAGTTSTTATADWTTFDTVGGYVPTPQQTLQFRPGMFLRAVCTGHWLVIDEINRAEIDKAFGELFTVLSGQGVDLPYTVGSQPVRVLPAANPDPRMEWVPADATTGYDYVMHPNWRIIATMNVYDKSSLFAMSFAFMRRFVFVDVDLPDPNAYQTLLQDWVHARPSLNAAGADTQALEKKFVELLLPTNEVMQRRALGPAIVKDMVTYIDDRYQRIAPAAGGVNALALLGEAFLLYALPQLDGLDHDGIIAVYRDVKRLFEIADTRHPILARLQSLYPHLHLEQESQQPPGILTMGTAS